MKVPLELHLSLRSGTVFYMADRKLTSAQPHFFIVVNRDPLGDELLLLTVASSKVDKVKNRRQREDKSTVVEISSSDYADFTKDSVIDCNQVFTKSLRDLCDQWERKEIDSKKDLPSQLLIAVQNGVLASRLVSEADKAKIRPANSV